LAKIAISAYTEDSASLRGGVSSHAPVDGPGESVDLDSARWRRIPAARIRTSFWSEVMAQVCDICGKGPQFGNNISHAHNVTRRRWNVNLQAVKALVNGSAKRIRVCTSCIKAGKIAKA
jgi:large subunit ribosomal protein L28